MMLMTMIVVVGYIYYHHAFLETWWWGMMTSRPTQPSIPSGSLNEYQLLMGRQRQVLFIPLADVRGVCRYNWDPLRMRAIPERLRCVFMTRRYINPGLPVPLPLCCSITNSTSVIGVSLSLEPGSGTVSRPLCAQPTCPLNGSNGH